MISLFLQLFVQFFLIGMFTFGGGYAVLGVVQSQVVAAKGWITESTFTDIVAVSQMTPGPVGLNCSTYVGYEVIREAGGGQMLATLGSLTASIAVVLPSFLIMLLIVGFYLKFSKTPVFQGVLSALRPAVAGLIGASALVLTLSICPDGVSLVTSNFPDWKSWVLAALAFCAYTFLKAGPVLILALGGLAGFIIYFLI